MKTKSFKTPNEDTLKGIGLGGLGWSEGSRVAKNVKRLMTTFDDTPKTETSKKNKVEVFCDCCKANFKISKDRKNLPSHTRVDHTYKIDEAGIKVYYKIEVECKGNLVYLGKSLVDSIKFPSFKKYGNTTISEEIVVKPNDILMLYCVTYEKFHNHTQKTHNNRTKYNRLSSVEPLEYLLVEKTVSKIVKSISKYGYSRYQETIEVYFTDGTKKSDYYIKDTTII